MSTRGEALQRMEHEIAAEKAAALGRVGERLEAVLGEAAREALGLRQHRVVDQQFPEPPRRPLGRA